MTTKTSAKLIVLYQQMADLTAPECATVCRAPRSCCSPEYCAMAIDYAKRVWDTVLTPIQNQRLPLMGPSGCTAEPHLRPLCTIHTCAINGFGFKPNDQAWTKAYFKLRNKIERLDSAQ